MLALIQEQSPEDLRIVYRHFPLISIHDKASLSAQAAEAAGAQGQFWPMHDLLFERQTEWSSMSVEQFREWLLERAKELELDSDQFAKDIDSKEIADRVQADYDRGAEIGLPGTPFLLI